MAEDWIVGMAPVPDDVPRSSKQMIESIQGSAGDDFMKPGHVISSIRHFLGDGGTGGRGQGDTRVSQELLRDLHSVGYISGLTANALDVAGPVLTRRHTLAGAAACAMLPWRLDAASAARRLSNPAANGPARALYAWLWSLYGRRTLSGQQESPSKSRDELRYIERTTGKLPALLGLDYIDPADWGGVRERALDWHRRGGVVTVCWHWGAPDIGTGYENSKRDFDVSAALRPGTTEHRLMTEQMDAVAGELAWLRDHNVPVLWRPFHEFSGDWFWWGKHGPEGFLGLWRAMYERFCGQHRLDNLIWVLGWAGQNVDALYYPGRGMVDIAGADIYVDHHGNLAPMFAEVKRIVGDSVPICLHENGPIPDPTSLGPDADWLWFMTWHTRWLESPDQNSVTDLRAAYTAKRYLTLDEIAARRGRGMR